MKRLRRRSTAPAEQAGSFAFRLRYYAGERGREWLASLAYTYRRGGDLCYLIEGPDNVAMVDDVLAAGELEGYLLRGKVDTDHSLRAFAALQLGGASFGTGSRSVKLQERPRHYAWTLTDAGIEFFKRRMERDA